MPREGHDAVSEGKTAVVSISIHVPREGHDPLLAAGYVLPAANFNPRAPRGARPHKLRDICKLVFISIHVPREGHDRNTIEQRRELVISIHVPREGHDKTDSAFFSKYRYFNPRAPRGARLCMRCACCSGVIFQSTCPARGTTHPFKNAAHVSRISIHVPREGHD